MFLDYQVEYVYTVETNTVVWHSTDGCFQDPYSIVVDRPIDITSITSLPASQPESYPCYATSTMADKEKKKTFSIGRDAKREVRRALRESTNPEETIQNFQKTRSLHSMFAQAFGTIPQHAVKEEKQGRDDKEVESLDTDSVLTFLTHLGVSQHEVHKRIADQLQKQLEDEIRRANHQEALLNLLRNSWRYATKVPELRPILWAILKQLGDRTPLPMLQALGERESDGKLKHPEIFRPLPPLLKRLVWEADWDKKVPIEMEKSVNDPKQYLKVVQSTLLYETVHPLVENYCSTEVLVENAGKFFATSANERRILTTQRRALASTAAATSKSTISSTTTTALLGKAASGTTPSSSSETLLSSGKAVSQIRQLLGDTASGTASYRPKSLHAVLSMLMARHGAQAPKILTGCHLHCTLVADILLSAGGPLPKIYSNVHTLARILDDAVRNGQFTDSDLVKVQKTLKQIYEGELAEEEKDGKGTENKSKKKNSDGTNSSEESDDEESKKNVPTTFLKRQLNRIITAGINAMKDSDPRNLFLNPVTDAIAPGYSKIIKKPMCIDMMERKIDNNAYNSIQEWDSDVRLMFKNCVDYNRGKAGQWFRMEANRQLKVYRDEILGQANNLYKKELQLRNPNDELRKRKREEEEKKKAEAVVPLPPVSKKRKIDAQDYTLSMPALASMLLADPFVVRLLLDRALRSLRIDVLKGTTLPVAHTVIPSILQLLYMAEWSTQICALRGHRYVVPDPGLVSPESVEALEAMVPYDSLRRYLPVLMHLLLEAEFDKRLSIGGDLNPVANHLPRPPLPSFTTEEGSPPMQVAVALLEGAFVHVCLPGYSQEASLSLTFNKFAQTLKELTVSVWEERAFFVSLVPIILRHKARLNRAARDSMISTWMHLLRAPENDATSNSKKQKRNGSITSAAHEYFVLLLNEWASLGNLLMPRDLLLKTSIELVETVNKTEETPGRKFAELWQAEDAKDFEAIKKQYERMLSLLPESHGLQWREAVGLEKGIKEEEPEVDKMDED